MENQVARQELTALMGVAEPNQKRAIVNAILKTHPDNTILGELYAELNSLPAPTAMEEQAMQTIQQMKQAIDGKDQQIMQLTAQLEQLKTQQESQDKSYMFDLKKMELQHRYDMENTVLKAQLGQGADQDKAEAEVVKAELDAEKAAVQLDTQKVKSNTEMAKITASMFNGSL